jgi:CBS domain-containing protein
MEACDEHVSATDPLNEAVTKLRASPFPALPVLDSGSGKLVGLLTAENIAEMMLVRTALAAK